MKTKGLLVAAVMFSTPAVADIRGNGGDVVVCKDAADAITGIELLDFYEGFHRYGLEVDLSVGASYQDKLHAALNRLAAVDREFAERLAVEVDQFEDNTHFWPGIQLVDIPDSSHIATPRGCEIVQIAVQKEPEFPNEKIFTVSKDLWDDPHFSEEDRAGLVLHELLYREALKLDHTDSIKTRYLNAFLTSRSFVPEAVASYLDILKRTKIRFPRIFGFKGLSFFVASGQLRQMTFHENGWLSSAYLFEAGDWVLKNGDRFDLVPDVGGQAINVSFHANGVLKAARLKEPTLFTLERGSIRASQVTFDDQERLMTAGVGVDPQDAIELETNPPFKVHGYVYIHEGRFPFGGWTAADSQITVCGETLTMDKSRSIKFDLTLSHVAYIASVTRDIGNFCFKNPTSGQIDHRSVKGSEFELTNDGRVTRFRASDVTFVVQSKEIKIYGVTSFHANGQLAETHLLDKVRLIDVDGVERLYSEGSNLRFNESGFVLK